MHATVTATIAAARAVERTSPATAACIAMPLFTRSLPTQRVREHDRGVHDQARRSTLRVGGRDLAAYEWGTGADTILLAHGWRGRASQFAPIVRELRAEGFRLVAFDAPANGDSPGRRTDIRDWLAAIDAMQSRHGRFHAIVGHSFGGLAAVTAVRGGTATGAVVAIASMSRARYLPDAFAAGTGLGTAAANELASRFAGRVFPGEAEAEVWRRFDAAANPLPDDVPLLVVHDRGDREVAASEGERLHAAHGERSRLVLTTGSGHTRVLGADAALDAVTAFATGGLAGVDAIAAAAAEASDTRT
ncbi:alpha/beta fold hydrolase [Agromyces sp. CFH 90414]|uniref:Alpha/beta fold hydrolase n=1 Tax=Agromyces agglutinans TaxID=2662258 RepID=A0A6I2F4A1_9MICO|nr:alpha/beta hydrolase [Agromyces agglutinans]MRG59061.1 alpha/beta fold hydrolase [Agromyces agglutinans]